MSATYSIRGAASNVPRRLTRLVAPLSRPLAGRRWFRLWAIVEHVGRRSGAHYATPIVVRQTDGGFVVPMPFGDATQWARNVIAAGGCSMRWDGRVVRVVEPEIVDFETAMGAFNPIQRAALRAFGTSHYLSVRLAPGEEPTENA